MSRLVLQANESGAWRNVASFDAAQLDAVCLAVGLLARALADRCKWRIAEDQNGYKRSVVDDEQIRAAAALARAVRFQPHTQAPTKHVSALVALPDPAIGVMLKPCIYEFSPKTGEWESSMPGGLQLKGAFFWLDEEELAPDTMLDSMLEAVRAVA